MQRRTSGKAQRLHTKPNLWYSHFVNDKRAGNLWDGSGLQLKRVSSTTKLRPDDKKHRNVVMTLKKAAEVVVEDSSSDSSSDSESDDGKGDAAEKPAVLKDCEIQKTSAETNDDLPHHIQLYRGWTTLWRKEPHPSNKE